MGEVDMARQHPNVFGMRMFGAKVTPVREGSRTLTHRLTVATWNLCGFLPNNIKNICRFLLAHKVDVLLLQDPSPCQ